MSNHFPPEPTGIISTDSEISETQLNIFDQFAFHYAEKELDGDHCAHVIEYYAHQSELLDADIAASIAQLSLQQCIQEFN